MNLKEIRMELGKNRKGKKKIKFGQIEMAEALGVSQGFISKVESGKLDLGYRELKLLREKFKININKIIDEDI